jgi:alanine racemase
MSVPLRPTHAVVDLDALASNYRAIARALPAGCVPMPVVKADAYGHGAAHVAKRLAAEGARVFAVAVVEEGLELRRAGILQQILVMGWIGEDQLPALASGGLTPNVHSVEQLQELKKFCEREDISVRAHLKLDTGMTRLGVLPADVPRMLDLLDRVRGKIFLEGVFQNFASSDEAASRQTEAQITTFKEIFSLVLARGHRPTMVHVANSGATLLPPPFEEIPGLRISHVRPGLALYARVPGLSSEQNDSLSDVMSFVSVVDQVKTVSPGTRVGYGGTFVAARETTLAIVPAGYADGVPRSLSGHGAVLIAGKRCPLAGRVSMDLTTVDVTDLPARPARGDEAVFFGRQGGARLGVDEVAAAAGTVSWEILCGVGPRMPRIILSGGEIVARESKFL